MNRSTVVIFTLFLLTFKFSLSYAQAPDYAWMQTYGIPWLDEMGYSVQQTFDGGYILVGTNKRSYQAPPDVWLVKVSANGDSLWSKAFGDLYDYDEGYSVKQTSDSGYIITGRTGLSSDLNIYLIKTNTWGESLWTKAYGGYGNDEGYSVQQTSDGGYIVTGYRTSVGKGYPDIYLIKTDSLGDTLWTKTYGWSGGECGNSIQQTSDEGYVIVGYTTSIGVGGTDVYLLKTDSLGDTLWTKTYGGYSSDIGYSVRQTSDGGYVIAGKTKSYGAGQYDVYVIKTDSLGDTLWTSTFGSSSHDLGYSVQQTLDGKYIVAGYSDDILGSHGGRDVYLIKIDVDGNLLWEQYYGGGGTDVGQEVQQTADSSYIIVGVSTSFGAVDLYLIKTDKEGTLAKISAEPQSFETSLQRDEMITHKVEIVNLGDGTLHYSVSSDTAKTWVSPSPDTNSIEPFDTTNLYVTLDALDLEQGYYYDTLLLSSNAHNLPSITIPVTLIVLPKDTTFVYPNPYVPKRGHDNITFANLPEAGKIEVYTVANRLVWEYAFSNIGKHYNWDVQTNNGSDVASGVYIYVIRNAKNEVLEKKKFAIIR